jgi:alpha 1,3-mannosyltransferase
LDTFCTNILRDGYIDDQDSGVVVMDKSRLQVLVGLLNTCWMNSSPVREEVTYKVFHGDKETFWLGMALAMVPYAFEQQWGGMVGVLRGREDKVLVCGNTISHYGGDGNLIWYNGGLLRDKARDPNNYLVPEYQMKGGKCAWVRHPEYSFCCDGGIISKLSSLEHGVLEASVDTALKRDVIL